MNFTLPTALILQALEQGFRHGFDIMDATGLPSGTVYPALRRLEDEGLVRSAWDDPSVPRDAPPRRNYELTKDGEVALAESRRRFRILQPARSARLRRAGA